MPDTATQLDLITPDDVWRPWWVGPLVGTGMLLIWAMIIAAFFTVVLALVGTGVLLDEHNRSRLPQVIPWILGAIVIGAFVTRALGHRRWRQTLAVASLACMLTYIPVAYLTELGLAFLLAIALVIACLLMCAGLGWSQRLRNCASPQWWFARHLAAGLCPRCRYNIRDLPEPRCPECGGTWAIKEDAPPDDAASYAP